jgi:hypothetical protein
LQPAEAGVFFRSVHHGQSEIHRKEAWHEDEEARQETQGPHWCQTFWRMGTIRQRSDSRLRYRPVAKFSPRRVHFGKHADTDDEGLDLPKPALIRLQARRAAGIREAAETLNYLPGPGESLHALATARMDLTDVVNALVERLGRCDQLRIATLGYNSRNLRTMLRWMDSQAVGELTLLASLFFRAHNGELWEHTLEDFRQRRQRAACCYSHAKVVTLSFASGERLSIEGSANLCGNGSGREQFALIHDVGLHDFHATWIGEMVSKHETDTSDNPATG